MKILYFISGNTVVDFVIFYVTQKFIIILLWLKILFSTFQLLKKVSMHLKWTSMLRFESKVRELIHNNNMIWIWRRCASLIMTIPWAGIKVSICASTKLNLEASKGIIIIVLCSKNICRWHVHVLFNITDIRIFIFKVYQSENQFGESIRAAHPSSTLNKRVSSHNAVSTPHKSRSGDLMSVRISS